LVRSCWRPGNPAPARAQHAAALALASQAGDRCEQARAHNGLARSHDAEGDPVQAGDHWRRALARYTDLGLPEAADVRAQLTALGRGGDGPGAGEARSRGLDPGPAECFR
jgi:hypothetical protein